MPLKTGDKVKVIPLSNKLGRVVGSTNTSRVGEPLYLVRYEVGKTPSTVYSVVSAYFLTELTKVP
jgi:hypothetical protein